ncbi:MAG: methionyl-tRNA formyltransferase [Acidimicrobiia bacterium]|nr:methionyl-tRNA formyltransferase [Acidimicrobiia bacterium]
MPLPPAGEAAAALPTPPRHPQRLVYLGTPEMAVAPLVALHDAGFEVALVVTGADKRRGRGSKATPTPVKLAALDRGLPVSHDLADIADVGADLGVVVAFGRIIRRPVLEQLPMVNLHFSLLPRWRGAAPVERAILAGDERTGVCVMAVEEGLDTGGVYASADLAIRRTSTVAELGAQLTTAGSRLLVDTLQAGLDEPTPQVGEPSYAAKIGPDDLRLDWDRAAVDLGRIVRVGDAWTTFRGRRLKVHGARPMPTETGPGAPGALHGDQVTCGTGVLQLVEVQADGKGRARFADWANGARPTSGEVLGQGDGL